MHALACKYVGQEKRNTSLVWAEKEIKEVDTE